MNIKHLITGIKFTSAENRLYTGYCFVHNPETADYYENHFYKVNLRLAIKNSETWLSEKFDNWKEIIYDSSLDNWCFNNTAPQNNINIKILSDIPFVDSNYPMGSQITGNWIWKNSIYPRKSSFLSRMQNAPRDTCASHGYVNPKNPYVITDEESIIYCHVYVSKLDMPSEIWISFHDGKKCRSVAFWGFNLELRNPNIQVYKHGNMPTGGAWVRLEMTPDSVDFKPGDKIDGIGFYQQGGTVFWDKCGLYKVANVLASV